MLIRYPRPIRSTDEAISDPATTGVPAQNTYADPATPAPPTKYKSQCIAASATQLQHLVQCRGPPVGKLLPRDQLALLDYGIGDPIDLCHRSRILGAKAVQVDPLNLALMFSMEDVRRLGFVHEEVPKLIR